MQIVYNGRYNVNVEVWASVSHDCKLDLVTVQVNLNALRYQREILQASVVPHFDNHVLTDRPSFMEVNARPHRAHAVLQCLRRYAVETIPWLAKSPDLYLIEHIWDMFGRRVRQRDAPVQTLRDLEAALHQEWARLPQRQIQGMSYAKY